MQVIERADNLPKGVKGNIFLALGNFDGVHRGHQEVIRNAVLEAKRDNIKSGVFVFNPHPVKVINPGSNLMLLSDKSIKEELFSALGVEYLIFENFNLNISTMSPDEFLKEYLLEKINVRGVSTGFDYSFGKNATGNTNNLREWGEKSNFKVIVSPPVKLNNDLISSSVIRRMISYGEVEKASSFLNYYFYRKGKIIPGDGRGKKLGFPTANLQVASDLILPGRGVYFTAVMINDKKMYGATNVGMRPTFSSGNQTIEINILDFNESIYGKEITVYFIKKIRDEIAFPSANNLVAQLKKDISYCRELSKIYNESFKTGLIDNYSK